MLHCDHYGGRGSREERNQAEGFRAPEWRDRCGEERGPAARRGPCRAAPRGRARDSIPTDSALRPARQSVEARSDDGARAPFRARHTSVRHRARQASRAHSSRATVDSCPSGIGWSNAGAMSSNERPECAASRLTCSLSTDTCQFVRVGHIRLRRTGGRPAVGGWGGSRWWYTPQMGRPRCGVEAAWDRDDRDARSMGR